MEIWGFREVARHLGISWRLARKWGRDGVLPTLPKSKWGKGPVTVYRRHFKNTPFGPEYTHTTEERRVVDKVFDAAKIRAIDMTKLRKKLAKKAAP
jgi:hypothetical protein